MRRTKAEAGETRRRILNAAEHVFYSKGVSNATLEDVAKVAGVTRGAIYWHFQNKTDLFLELYKSVPLPEEDLIRRDIDEKDIDILAYIEGVAGDWLDIMARDEQRQRILTILLRCDYDSELAPVLAKQQEVDDVHSCFLNEAFSEALSRGGLSSQWTPEGAARTLRWMMKGLCSEWLLFGRRFDLAVEGRQALERLFGGFRPRKNDAPRSESISSRSGIASASNTVAKTAG